MTRSIENIHHRLTRKIDAVKKKKVRPLCRMSDPHSLLELDFCRFYRELLFPPFFAIMPPSKL
jgi:hypothetical protein